MISLPITDIQPARLAASIDSAKIAMSKTAQGGDATYMPSQRETSYGLKHLTQSEKKYSEYSKTNIPYLRSKKGAPSSITAENYLFAKALASKVYMQNIAAVKREYLSNAQADFPRFSNQISILA